MEPQEDSRNMIGIYPTCVLVLLLHLLYLLGVPCIGSPTRVPLIWAVRVGGKGGAGAGVL